ncbi:MAG TPA: hypothetical protein VMY35_07610 [Phycisphaerae bacterium]|nr:hypothetical protein [Phycisphaerae bacterium]
MRTWVYLQHICECWEWWEIPAAPRVAGIYIEVIRSTPCPKCHAKATKLVQARETLGPAYREYARAFLRRPAS